MGKIWAGYDMLLNNLFFQSPMHKDEANFFFMGEEGQLEKKLTGIHILETGQVSQIELYFGVNETEESRIFTLVEKPYGEFLEPGLYMAFYPKAKDKKELSIEAYQNSFLITSDLSKATQFFDEAKNLKQELSKGKNLLSKAKMFFPISEKYQVSYFPEPPYPHKSHSPKFQPLIEQLISESINAGRWVTYFPKQGPDSMLANDARQIGLLSGDSGIGYILAEKALFPIGLRYGLR